MPGESLMSAQHQHTNRLIDATSPYLLQHAHNPVDWYPWGEEALRLAREEDKPIFLSIGYAACHWCHVMERESFESEAIAEQLNQDFVCIKVDREERPDLDEIYMAATQLITHSGGWPMSVFLTPDLKPFYAGTYFPPEDRWGRPGFPTLLRELARAWRERRAEVLTQADRVVEAMEQFTGGAQGQGAVNETLVKNAVQAFERGYEPAYGGFGQAPKFPPSMRLELFLRRHHQENNLRLLRIADHTLEMMARGGMYDQVGGGFHRYSVDEKWLVPHFEKMLYDNALLSRVYTLAFEETQNWFYGRVAREIFDYILREMTHPEGGIYSTTDADSEGVEGKFFVWDPEEVEAVLGAEDGSLFCRIYDISRGGNWEGHSIPNLLNRNLDDWAQELHTGVEDLDARLGALRRKLWEHREKRVHPLLDDKILSGWNGLMIRAFAEGYRVLRDDRYREAAEHAAEFVLTRMREGGRLLRSYRNGQAGLNAYLEDYSYLSLALLDLHLATGNERWKDEGLRLLEQLEARFWDATDGGYYFTSHDHEQLITRAKGFQDGATPSGASMAVLAHIRAAHITGDEDHRRQAAEMLALASPLMDELPAGFPNMLVAANEYLREWPGGIRIAGADAVEVEANLSQPSVAPGGRIRIDIVLDVAPGNHINSHAPLQEYLIPTVIEVQETPGFTVVGYHYPPGEAHQAPFQDDALSVYSGSVTLSVELEADADLSPGAYPAKLLVRIQACDERQCYPPMEARIQIAIPVSA